MREGKERGKKERGRERRREKKREKEEGRKEGGDRKEEIEENKHVELVFVLCLICVLPVVEAKSVIGVYVQTNQQTDAHIH
eukprot:2634545-Ditylum_brightwellii.AAC.1